MNANAGAIVDVLLRNDDVGKYLWLCEASRGGAIDVARDEHFQLKYRAYWRMNAARLSAGFYATYFRLLAECRGTNATDIAAVVRDLYGAGDAESKRSLQFSFATKLAHTVNPRVPVYDSFVAAFYFYVPLPPQKPFEERLRSLMRFHDFLRLEYERVIRLRLLDVSFQNFREIVPPCRDVCDERLIDWLIWGWVRLLRERVQSDRAALYV